MTGAVLGFDCSGPWCAAALLAGGAVLDLRAEDMPKGQAERLMPMLEEMLARAGLAWPGLAALGVGTGPGNFTGVRIAVAAARGLALALEIPAVGVSALEAAANGAGANGTGGAQDPLWVALPARRGEIYLQSFAPGDGGTPPIASAAPRIALEADAPPCARGPLPPGDLALVIARLAAARAGGLGSRAAPRPAPLYVRAADAAPPSEPPPRILP